VLEQNLEIKELIENVLINMGAANASLKLPGICTVINLHLEIKELMEKWVRYNSIVQNLQNQ
jgi:hypothetical protein